MPHQYRIACLRIPGFQIAAHQKAEPALKNKPLVITSATGAGAKLLYCSARAGSKHLWPGMRLSEARAAVADLVWREACRELYELSQKELTGQLLACSPRVTAVEPGLLLLDASGLAHLGGEEQFCKNLQKAAGLCGFADSHVGIADSAFCALVASRYKNKRCYLVPPGQSRQFLQELSIGHLPYADLRESCALLGIRTMGQFAALAVREIEERFGSQGLAALRLCLGDDELAPELVQPEKTFQTGVELGFPVESMDQCRFIFKKMLEELTAKLKQNDLAAESIFIEFFNDHEKIDERTISLIQPSTSSKFLLELVRLSLESSPLSREFTRVTIGVPALGPQRWAQHKLEVINNFCEPEASLVAEVKSCGNESLLLLLERLAGKLGQNSVSFPARADQHLPDRAGVFLPVQTGRKAAEDLVLPLSIEALDFPGDNQPLACGLVLKRQTPSRTVLVKYDGQVPQAITFQGRWYRIVEMSEPERLSGLWWESPVDKSYFVTLIEPQEPGGAGKNTDLSGSAGTSPVPARRICAEKLTEVQMRYLVLLVHDHICGSWQIDGFFD